VKQIRSYVDERQSSFCVFCHGRPETRDHVPPRVFLDEPYPENLPVVGSCRACNEGASLDEEYLACLLEAAACGSTDPGRLGRAKISRRFSDNPSLAARLAMSLRVVDGVTQIEVEQDRVSRVIEKIARALWAFETGEPTGFLLARVWFVPLPALEQAEREAFMSLAVTDLLPEVGGRMMSRVLVVADESIFNSWEDVQTERFTYAVEILRGRGRVKMILRGYLAAEVDLLSAEEELV
jgi:hypothetical protein